MSLGGAAASPLFWAKKPPKNRVFDYMSIYFAGFFKSGTSDEKVYRERNVGNVIMHRIGYALLIKIL